MKHINIDEGRILQDGRDVRTKRSKTIEGWFFPVGDNFRAVLAEWLHFLTHERKWEPGDPVFPKTRIVNGNNGGFVQGGLERAFWSNAAPIRRIFMAACKRADLTHFNPHSIRNTLARLGLQRCVTAEQFKAWSQNLAHEKVLTTSTSYGQVDRLRQRAIMRDLEARDGTDSLMPQGISPEMVAAVIRAIESATNGAALPDPSVP